MSAAVMSNYYFAPPVGQRFVADTRYPLQNWMFAHMAQYPPPPQPDQQHYNALYPTNAGAQQLLDPQDQLQYNNLNQALYPKVETATTDHASSNHQIQNLAQDLHQQVALNEHQGQNIHHQGIHGQQSTNSQASQSSSHQGTPDQTQKANRLRKACDSCSIRKVKCDESGPPCRACTALDIPCTFERPSRRRGPPNRHAEALKRRRLDEAADSSNLSPPTSPTHAAQALAALSAQTSSQQLSAESICPVETMNSLIDDFFTYIHPLCPFPHEPSFREAWKRREDVTNSSFLALLASMIGALVSSFPRKPRLHLQSRRRGNPIPNYVNIVSRCQKICNMARGTGYLGSDNLSVYDAATSYFMGLTALYMFRWRQARLYFGECLNIIRTLGLHKAKEQAYTQLGRLPASVGSHSTDHEGNRDQTVDNITIQMGRRIFWTLFVTIRSMQQLGATFDELVLPPPTSSDPYPPLPAELDDFCIYPTQMNDQPAGQVPLVTGFNANVSLYRSCDSLATGSLVRDPDGTVDWERQSRAIHESLARCKEALGGLASNRGVTFMQPRLSRDPATSLINEPDKDEDDEDSEQRRQTQSEIQRANIVVSGLSTRAYLVDSYLGLRESLGQPATSRAGQRAHSSGSSATAAGSNSHTTKTSQGHDVVEREMRREQDMIAKDILTALSSLSEVNMEPSADNFTSKIRALASDLHNLPDQRKTQMILNAQEDIASFLNDLRILEGDTGSSGDDTTQIRAWDDLRQRQANLARLAAQ